jgi:hypothetical protein
VINLGPSWTDNINWMITTTLYRILKWDLPNLIIIRGWWH